ncbi:MAG: hypothetical protein GX644_18045 [Limnobacter sp.]|nr:hypothetical protein [Limnobacter sp.]
MTSCLRLSACAMVAAGVLGACLVAAAAEAERGQALYDLRCGGCHETSVHQRASRSAQTFEQIREAVVRWQREVGADWRADEIDAVTWHLNERYYKLPCPTAVCGMPRASATAR